MSMSMSLGVEFVMKDSFSGPTAKIASSFHQLRASVGGLPGMTAQFNGFSKSVEQGTQAMLKGKGGGGGGGGGKGEGGLQAMEGIAGKIVTSFAALKGAAAGLDMFQEPLQSARAFGVEMGQIRTIISEDALSNDRARDAAFGMANAYGTDATVAAKGLYETISAGVTDAAQATDLLKVANEFAIGGNTDLAAGVDILTSAVNTYSEQGLSARDASDALFTAIAAGKTTAAELSQKLGEVAPTAQAAGISFKELTGAIAALTLQGIKTPQAVTGLNAMISNIAKPSKDAATEAKRLGIEWSLTALKGMGLQNFLKQLAGNTKVNVESFPKLFGSIDGIKAAFALTAQDGKKLNEVLDQMAHGSGATTKAFEVMAETSDFQYKRFDALKKNAMTLIGEALEPLAVKALKLGSDLIAAFNDLPQGVRDAIVQGVAMVGMFLTAATAVLGFASGISAIMGPLEAVAASFGTIATVGAPLVALFAFLGLGVEGLKVGVDKNIWGIGDVFRQMVADVKLAFDALSQLFSGGEVVGDSAAALMDPANAGILKFVTTIYTAVARMQEFFSQLSAGFDGTIGAAGPTFEAFRTSLEGLMAAFGGVNDAMASGDASTAFDEAGASGKSFGTTLGNIAAIALRVMSGLMDFAAGAVSNWEAIKSALAPIGEALSGIGTPIAELAANFSTASGAGSGFVSVGRFIVQVLANMITFVGHVVSAFASTFRGVINIVSGVVDFLDGLFHGRWSQMWKGLGRIVYGVVTMIVGMVGGMASAVLSILDDLARVFGVDLGAANFVSDFTKKLDTEFKYSLGVAERPKSAEPVDAVSTQPPSMVTQDTGNPDLFGTVASTDDSLIAPTDSLVVVPAEAKDEYVAPADSEGTAATTAATEANTAAIAAAADAMSAASVAMEQNGKRPVKVDVNLDINKVASGVKDVNSSDDDLSYKP